MLYRYKTHSDECLSYSHQGNTWKEILGKRTYRDTRTWYIEDEQGISWKQTYEL